MSKLKILELKPTQQDFEIAAKYASVTLPWTFNRMMANTSSQGQQGRGLNIAKGIVAQEVMKKALAQIGITAELERKSYRDDDLFDFRFPINGEEKKLDLKSIHYYSDYNLPGREPLTADLIRKHAAYPGPDWRTFFPMLIPHTQIGQEKEVYCFAISSSIDFRNKIDLNRNGYALTAYPYGEQMAFLSSPKLCTLREEKDKGIWLSVHRKDESLFTSNPTKLKILGEWAGKGVVREVNVSATKVEVGPFSCVSSFQVERDVYGQLSGEILIEVAKNDLKDVVLNTAKRNLNSPVKQPLSISKSDFCNLVLPNDYKLFVIGWTTKGEFLKNCRKYKGWVWPIDKTDKYLNTPWSQITVRDETSLTRAGFADCIQKKPSMINAGWMKTNGAGGGACCYVFPNIGRNGGIKETNLYVLPQDLNSFEALKG
jgi:hypothetical protein